MQIHWILLAAASGVAAAFLAWQVWRLTQSRAALRLALMDAEKACAVAQAKADQSERTLTDYMRAIEKHALVSVADAKGFIVEVNERLVEVSGYSRDELIGMDHRQLDSDPDEMDPMLELRATLSAGHIWRGELCSRTKQGELYWLDCAIVPMRDAKGAIKRFLHIGVDVTDRKHAAAELARRATHDTLTGLANRTLLRDRMHQALESCRRTGELSAVLFLDLNRFKRVNDDLGHDAGDALLMAVALRLKALVRAEETVARLGGDEFVVFVPRLSDPTTAQTWMSRIVHSLSQPFELGSETVQVGTSVGLAMFPADADSVDGLMKFSDAAMYRAKEQSRQVLPV